MQDLLSPRLSVDASGQVLLARENTILSHLEWTWADSEDNGANWSEFVLENDNFSSTDARSGSVYRAQEILPAGQASDPLQNEVVFTLAEDVADSGVVTWTLTQPTSERNLLPIISTTLSDLADVTDWTAIFRSTEGNQFEERIALDDGFVETGIYLINSDLDYVWQSTTTEDAANLTSWESTKTYFDTDRFLSVSEVIFDSGKKSKTFEDTNGIVETVLTDALDAEPWRTLTTFFDDGVKSSEYQELDDGTETISFSVTDCIGEVQAVSSERSYLSAGGDAFVWADPKASPDDNGLTLDKILSFENENLLEETVFDGVLGVIQTTDTDDQFVSSNVNETWEIATRLTEIFIDDAIL